MAHARPLELTVDYKFNCRGNHCITTVEKWPKQINKAKFVVIANHQLASDARPLSRNEFF